MQQSLPKGLENTRENSCTFAFNVKGQATNLQEHKTGLELRSVSFAFNNANLGRNGGRGEFVHVV